MGRASFNLNTNNNNFIPCVNRRYMNFQTNEEDKDKYEEMEFCPDVDDKLDFDNGRDYYDEREEFKPHVDDKLDFDDRPDYYDEREEFFRNIENRQLEKALYTDSNKNQPYKDLEEFSAGNYPMQINEDQRSHLEKNVIRLDNSMNETELETVLNNPEFKVIEKQLSKAINE